MNVLKKNGNKTEASPKKSNYQDRTCKLVTDLVKAHNPETKVNDFEDLVSRNDYLDIMNLTLDRVLTSKFEHNDMALDPKHTHLIKLKKNDYRFFWIKVKDMRCPLYISMRLTKDTSYVNYELYVSSHERFTGFNTKYDKKFQNQKYIVLGDRKDLKFKQDKLYFSLFADGIGKLTINFKFEQVISSREKEELAKMKLDKQKKKDNKVDIFADFEEEIMKCQNEEEKIKEIQLAKWLVKTRRDGLDYLSKNMTSICSFRKNQSQKIKLMNENY